MEELLRKTMKNAAVETCGNGKDDNNGVDEVQKQKKKKFREFKIVLDNYKQYN